LRRAHALAEGCGAGPVRSLAAAGLAALGLQPGPAGADGLTVSERRIASLAAEGRTDRDIAPRARRGAGRLTASERRQPSGKVGQGRGNARGASSALQPRRKP
jgi:hypothetical protein